MASRGAGASTVLAAVVSEVDAQGRVVHVIAGADAVAEVPLAPFGPVAQTYGVHDGEALRLYTSLGPRVVEADAVVVVDDADRLDPASAVLVTQLLRAGVPCLLGCRDDGALGRPLREQLARASASVVALDLLDSDEMLELAAHQLGDQLSPPSSATLLAHARGVPVVATELLRATPVTGSPSGLVLGDLVITDPVRALVAEVLVGLDAAALDVLDLLAVAGALPRHRLPAPAVELLEARGLVTWVEGDSIELADPLVDDVLTDAMGPLARRRVSARAADLVDGVPGWEGLAVVLTVDAGRPVSPADAARSARRALAIGRSAEARTVLAAVEGDHDAEHHLLLGAALAADGEVERAGHHLDRAEQLAADDDVRVQVGQELGLLHAGGGPTRRRRRAGGPSRRVGARPRPSTDPRRRPREVAAHGRAARRRRSRPCPRPLMPRPGSTTH